MTLFDVVSRQRRLVLLVVGLVSVAGIWAGVELPTEAQLEYVYMATQGS